VSSPLLVVVSGMPARPIVSAVATRKLGISSRREPARALGG
jgi:hypothetical protein